MRDRDNDTLLCSDTIIIARAELRLQQCFLRNNYQFKFYRWWLINPYVWLKEHGQRKALANSVRILSDLLFEKRIQESRIVTARTYDLYMSIKPHERKKHIPGARS